MSELKVTQIPEGKIHFGWYDKSDKSKIYAAGGIFVVPSGRTDITLAPVFDDDSYVTEEDGDDETGYGKIKEFNSLFAGRGCAGTGSYGKVVVGTGLNAETGFLVSLNGGTQEKIEAGSIIVFQTREVITTTKDKIARFVLENFGEETMRVNLRLIKSSGSPTNGYADTLTLFPDGIELAPGEVKTFDVPFTTGHGSTMVSIESLTEVNKIEFGMTLNIVEKATAEASQADYVFCSDLEVIPEYRGKYSV